MNCKTCDYPLWNLHSRQCPECGSGFKPSDYRFALNAVRYACQHCGQGYYGTGDNGHLEPQRFACVGCGEQIDMDEMVLLPTDGVDERQTHVDTNPWLDTDRRFLARWFQTLYRGACMPVWLLRSTPSESDAGSAWGFAIFTQVLFGIVMIAPLFLFMAAISMGSGGGPGIGGVFGIGIGMVVGTAVVSVVAMGFWVLVTHGVLRLLGGADGGIGRTSQAICYTCGPQVCMLVPCLGFQIGWIGTLWWVMVAGFALSVAHKASGWRSAIAISVFPAVVGACMVAGVVLFFTGITRSMTMYSTTNTQSVTTFYQPLRAAADSGAWPAHAGEMLLDGSVTIYDITSPMSPTLSSDCVLDTSTLASWGGLGPSVQRGLVDRAAQGLSAKVVAHRFGDFVFTYHGIDPVSLDTNLWLVIEAWDTAVPGNTQAQVHVLTGQGGTMTFPRSRMDVMLTAQNAVRASHGLNPLPDPFSVRHEQPAADPLPNDPG
jgi:hypothetical protein